MVVIGDKNSSNTKKLYNICKKNCNTMLVESSKDLELKCLKNCDCVGIIAGASTPRETIEEVKGAMEKHFGLENEKEENFEQLLEESLKGSSKGRIVKGKVVSIGANEVYVDVVGMKHSGVIPRAELTNVPNISLAEVVNVGDELDLLITYINDQEGTVTLSKLKADLDLHWKEFEEARESGTVLVGRVCRVVKSGLLVSYRSLDVFIPSSQVGGSKMIPFESYLDKDVEFKIIDLDKRKKRIVGSIKEVKEETQRTKLHEFWNSVEIGKAYRGIVKSITNYAVFVDLGKLEWYIGRH